MSEFWIDVGDDIIPGPIEYTLTVRLDNRDGRFELVPEVGQRVMLTVEQPRPWWRRLLRLSAKSVRRGPYRLEQWPG